MFVKEFLQGIKAYAKGNRVIFKYNLWPYMILPGMMSLLYVLLLIFAGTVYFPDLSGFIMEKWIPEVIKGGIMGVITSVLLWIFLIFIGYMTYKPVILILFSPVLSYLSEITENAVYNRQSPDFDFKQLLKDILRGLVINMRNIFLMLMFIFLAWLLIFIPVIGAVFSAIMIFLIQFFYDGSGLVDYTLERKRYSVRESIRFVRSNRARVTGVGMGFFLLMLIPVAGWFTAPTYGTVAATLAALEKINENDPQLENL